MAIEQDKIQLSRRELQVLELVVSGASNQEIAQKLVISLNTVKVHVRNIFGKLEVQSRTEASVRAIQEGLVTVTDNGAPASNDEIEATPTKTYLLDPNPSLVLPQWQQIYFLMAVLVAALVVAIPWLPQNRYTLATLPPVIYKPVATPTLPLTTSDIKHWTPHPSMDGGRAGLALVSLNDKLYAIGGVKENNTATRSMEIYNTGAREWVEGNNKPTAAANITAEVLDDRIYVPGGCTHEGTALDVLEIYNPADDSWSEGQPLPKPRCAYGLVAFQNKLYLFGGWNGQAFEDSIFVYSPAKDSWTTSKYTLPQPLGHLGATVLDDTIYIAGGYDGQAEFDTTYTFDPTSGQWTPKARLNEKRGGLGLVSHNGILYAVGGGWDHDLTTSEEYYPVTDSWTPFETPSTSQWRNMGLTIAGNAIYAVGGWDGAAEEFMNDVSSYQIAFQTFLPLSIR
ncbi:MAG: hypothetical protein KDI79_16875 [Anaerolineae bacterium]|nr:hypothetical protein [Anaerolineae bacterium]